MAIKIKTIQKDVEVTDTLTCDNCGEVIPLVFPGTEAVTEQGRNALGIDFSGGYGMYVDPLVTPKLHVLWCQSCAERLEAAFPSITELFGGGLG